MTNSNEGQPMPAFSISAALHFSPFKSFHLLCVSSYYIMSAQINLLIITLMPFRIVITHVCSSIFNKNMSQVDRHKITLFNFIDVPHKIFF